MTKNLRAKLSSRALSMLVIITLMSFGISAAFADEPPADPPTVAPLAGGGTYEDPYEITSCTDLQRINEQPGAAYVLTQNIDCVDSPTFNDGQGFFQITQFNGTYLDGRNFIVSNLSITASEENSFGFIKSLGANSILRNIRFENLNLTNTNTTNIDNISAGLVGSNNGLIDRVATNGTINSAGYVGGIVGSNFGSITRSSSTLSTDGSETTTHYAGGIAGYSQGTIADTISYAAINIDPTNDSICGGLVGWLNNGSITRSYTSSMMECVGNNNQVGGLVGLTTGSAAITNSFARTTPNHSNLFNGAIVGTNNNATDLSSNYFPSDGLGISICDSSGNTNCGIVEEGPGGANENYFFNNTSNAPINTWDFNLIWSQQEFTPGLHFAQPLNHLSPNVTSVTLSEQKTEATLTWEMPGYIDANGNNNIDNFEIIYKTGVTEPAASHLFNNTSDNIYERNTYDPTWQVMATLPADQLSYTATNLDINTRYDFRIRAINSWGKGLPSYPVKIDSAPQKLSTPTLGQAYSAGVQVLWTDENSIATSYNVQYKKSTDSEWSSFANTNYPSPSAFVYPLEESTTYDFRVAALNDRGVGEYSDILTATTTAPASYEISTCEELQNINDDTFGSYTLTQDIDCAESAEWNDGEGFKPIGMSNSPTGLPFVGTLDGNNHVISNIYMDRPGEVSGLFGFIAGATIKNLTLDGGQIAGTRANDGTVYTDASINPIVGAVSAFASLSTIDNVKSNIDMVSDSVGGINGGVGGLVGMSLPVDFGPFADNASLTLTNSEVTGHVSGMVAGGLVGGALPLDLVSLIASNPESFNDSLPFIGSGMDLVITDSNSAGNVECIFICGGIVGGVIGNTTIDNVTRSGNVGQLTEEVPFDLGDSFEDIVAGLMLSGPIAGGVTGLSLPISLSGGDATLSLSNTTVDGNIVGTIASGVVGINLPSISVDFSQIAPLFSGTPEISQIMTVVLTAISKLMTSDALDVSGVTVNADVFCTVACGGVTSISLGKTLIDNVIVNGSITNDNETLIESGSPVGLCPVQITGGITGAQVLFPLDVTNSKVNGDVEVRQAGNMSDMNLIEIIQGAIEGTIEDPDDPTALIGVICSASSVITGSGGAVGSFVSPLDISGVVENILGQNTGTLPDFALGLDNVQMSGEVVSSNRSATGGLVGNIFGESLINNSFSTGDVTNSTFADMFRTPVSSAATGGLVGRSLGGYQVSGNIITLIATVITLVDQDGESTEEIVDSLETAYSTINISSGYSVIQNSHASGHVYSSNSAGGLVGTVSGITQIKKSYATGDVYGTSAGGLIGSGFNMGGLLGVLNLFSTIDLENTYARGDVFTSDNTDIVTFGGGLVGMMAHFGEFNIRNSYSTGSVEVENGATDTRLVAGGLVGAELDMSILPTALTLAFENSGVPQIVLTLLGALGLEVKSGVSISNSFTTSSVPARSSGDDKLFEEIATGNISDYKTTGSIFGFLFSLDTENFPEFPTPAEGESLSDEDLFEFISEIQWNTTEDIVSNTYYDRTKNPTNRCASSPPSMESFFEDIYTEATINEGEEAPTPEEIMALLPKLVGDSGSTCVSVNTNGTQDNLFKNNNTVAPLNTWNFTNMWYSHPNDFPTFTPDPSGPNDPSNPNPPTNPPNPPTSNPFIPTIPQNPGPLTNPITQIIPNDPPTVVLDNVIDKVDGKLDGDAEEDSKEPDTGIISAVTGIFSKFGAFLLQHLVEALLIMALGAGLVFISKKKKVLEHLKKS